MSSPVLTPDLARYLKSLQDRVKWLETNHTYSIALAPTVAYQFKHGGTGVGLNSANLTSASLPHTLIDAQGLPMTITVTPPSDALWFCNAWCHWGSVDAPWSWVRWQIQLNLADVDGFGARERGHVNVTNSFMLQHSHLTNAFRLAPGVTYTATLRAVETSGNSQFYWRGSPYLGLEGRLQLI